METYYVKISAKYYLAHLEDGSLGICASLEVVDSNLPTMAVPLFEDEGIYNSRLSIVAEANQIEAKVEKALQNAREEFLRIVGILKSSQLEDKEIIFTA